MAGAPHSEGLSKPVVLLVDDDPDLGGLIATLLSDGGFRVVLASDSVTARERIADLAEILLLVITDVCLETPDAGILLAQELLARSPGIPVILTTGFNVNELAADYKLAGVALLQKPFTADELTQEITGAVTSVGWLR